MATIAVRVFRGNRRASVYRDHLLDEDAFDRIRAAGARAGLPILSSLASRRPLELDRDDAARLARELSALQAGAALPELDRDLTLLAELARWCGRTRGGGWLRIA